jgi:hypothetical protein
MYGFVLQDWITIRGDKTITSVPQSESAWLGLSAFEDIVFWLDVRELTLGAATSVTVNYETAPLKDESLFVSMVSGTVLTAMPTNPTIVKVLLAQNPTVPLGRWVRWRLTTQGSPTSQWDLTFRLLACANAVGVGGSG